MEVDISEVDAGAVLSQWGPDQKSHPCCFFPKKGSLTAQRYEVADQELLAIKWALEEWHHLLPGTPDPFFIWTDHQKSYPHQTG